MMLQICSAKILLDSREQTTTRQTFKACKFGSFSANFESGRSSIATRMRHTRYPGADWLQPEICDEGPDWLQRLPLQHTTKDNATESCTGIGQEQEFQGQESILPALS